MVKIFATCIILDVIKRACLYRKICFIQHSSPTFARMSASALSPSLLYSRTFPITAIWKSLRPFLKRDWVDYYFNLMDEKIWNKIDLSTATKANTQNDSLSLQVQVFHNDQYGVSRDVDSTNESLIYKTCVTVILRVIGSNWAFECSPSRYSSETKMLVGLCEHTGKDNVGRISAKDFKWGLVMEFASPKDTDDFLNWWQAISRDQHILDLMQLSSKVPASRYIEAIKVFYKQADPTKSASDIDKVLTKYDSKLVTLMNMLWHKYGNHPIVALKDIIKEENAIPVNWGSDPIKTSKQQDSANAYRESQNAKFMELLHEFIAAIPDNISIPPWEHEGIDILIEEYEPIKRSISFVDGAEQRTWYRCWSNIE